MVFSFGAGMTYGTTKTIKFFINLAFELMNRDKIHVEIDEDMIINGLLQYQNNIQGCLFLENAPISNDTRDKVV